MKKLRSPKMAYTLCFLFSLHSCQEAVVQSSAGYSGEELLRGIFLGQGEVASKLPEINNIVTLRDYLVLDQYQLDLINEAYDLLIQDVAKNNPSLMRNFKRDIQSGDHVRIHKALAQAGIALKESSIDISGYSEQQVLDKAKSALNKYDLHDKSNRLQELKSVIKKFDSREIGDGEDIGFALVVIVVVALAIAAIINIAGVVEYAAVAVDVEVIVNDEKLKSGGQGFVMESLVNSISENLSTR